MRIISGSHKGRKIRAPKTLPVRPTTDMAKEALFNILGHRIDLHDLDVLELFSGSGNMSYEFCSRGASKSLAVDEHAPCVAFVKKTAEEFEFPISVVNADVFKFLEQHNGNHDMIFADPPYALEKEGFESIINNVFERNMLREDGMLIIEHSKRTDLSDHPHFDNQRKYGGTVFSFFFAVAEGDE